MKLIVGLGNPGGKYKNTRHNVGFEVAARLAKKFATAAPRAKFQGEIVEATVAGQKLLVLTPLTYMNASGASVLATRDFYKIENEDILVVCDDSMAATSEALEADPFRREAGRDLFAEGDRCDRILVSGHDEDRAGYARERIPEVEAALFVAGAVEADASVVA